jgi:hypothetical protein
VMAALCGLVLPSKAGITTGMSLNDLRLLTGPLGVGAFTLTLRSANGYLYTSWTPNHTTTATGATASAWTEGDATSPTNVAVTEDANNGERYFQVGCAAQDYGNSGRRPFVISQDGQVRSPAVPASANQFYGAATAPANGATPTLGTIQLGMALACGKAVYATTMFDVGANFNAFPVYTK